MPGICKKKLYYNPIMILMNAIFCMFTHLIYEYMIFYAKKASIASKCQKQIKKGEKKNGKMPGICQKMILYPNYDIYEI